MAAKRSLQSKYRIDETSGCWIWIAYVHKTGYGRVSHHGKATSAHRAVYEIYKGKIPDGLQLDHLCRNRRCVNPEHLEPVTQRTNLRRGKHILLSAEIVAEVRKRYLKGERLFRLGIEFNVSDSHLSRIVRGLAWPGVSGPISAVDGRMLFPCHIKENHGNTNSAPANAAGIAS